MKEDEIKEILEEAEEIAKDFDGGWWNYRVIEKTEKWDSPFDRKIHTENYYEIHEVYYNGKGEIIAWSENSISLYFESYRDFKDTLKHIKQATKRSVLKLEDDKLEDTHKLLKFRSY